MQHIQKHLKMCEQQHISSCPGCMWAKLFLSECEMIWAQNRIRENERKEALARKSIEFMGKVKEMCNVLQETAKTQVAHFAKYPELININTKMQILAQTVIYLFR